MARREKRSCILLFCVLAGVIAANGCRKPDTDNLNHGTIHFTIKHHVDGRALVFDTLLYTNNAVNHYSVQRLQYYISNIRFYQQRKLIYTSPDAHYIDARIDSLSEFEVSPQPGIPPGNYDSLAFFVGLAPALNVSNGLPATLNNTGMAWPDEMGGGYHFLKLEGHWLDGTSLAGFAMHIGQNGFTTAAGTGCRLFITSAGDAGISLSMNINEWFRTPDVYNFSTDGVFSMGDSLIMKKLAVNGADAFTAN